MVDLNKCIVGDKLVSVHGEILTYVAKLPDEDYYDHQVMYADGSLGSRTNDGYVYRNADKRLPVDHNIVHIVPRKDHNFVMVYHWGRWTYTRSPYNHCEKIKCVDYLTVVDILDRLGFNVMIQTHDSYKSIFIDKGNFDRGDYE